MTWVQEVAGYTFVALIFVVLTIYAVSPLMEDPWDKRRPTRVIPPSPEETSTITDLRTVK